VDLFFDASRATLIATNFWQNWETHLHSAPWSSKTNWNLRNAYGRDTSDMMVTLGLKFGKQISKNHPKTDLNRIFRVGVVWIGVNKLTFVLHSPKGRCFGNIFFFWGGG